MAINKKNFKMSNKVNNGKKKHKANWLLRFTLIVVIIPAIILVWILATSLETSGEPVVGKRFENQLDPAISEKQVTALKDSIQYAEDESVEVNLKSATLRITINTIDTATPEQIGAILMDVYQNKVNAQLPIETYFTNKEGMKMYDLEIHVYNFIPMDTSTGTYVYQILTKNAASNDYDITTPSTPRNAEVNKTIEELPQEGETVGQ